MQNELINNILQKLDIEGLIEAGAPVDEYASEAGLIAAALAELKQSTFHEQDVISLLCLVWAKSFNLSDDELKLRMPLMIEAAKDISNL